MSQFINGAPVLVAEPLPAAMEKALGFPAERRVGRILGRTERPAVIEEAIADGQVEPEGVEYYVVEPRDYRDEVPASLKDTGFYAMWAPGRLAEGTVADGFAAGQTMQTLVLVGECVKSEFGEAEAERIESAMELVDYEELGRKLLGE